MRIEKTSFKNVMGTGASIEVRSAEIVNNNFDACTGPAIYIGSDASKDFHAHPATNVKISGNKIENCNMGADREAAAIQVGAEAGNRRWTRHSRCYPPRRP